MTQQQMQDDDVALQEFYAKATKLFQDIYPEASLDLLQDFVKQATATKQYIAQNVNTNIAFLPNRSETWYQDCIMYCLYVDLFNKDFQGLIERLDYLQKLGVTCLWLLPFLDSPMKDAGFDISNYHMIRPALVSNASNWYQIFEQFVQEAHKRGIAVLMDIAMNHSSDQHAWFQQALANPNSPYRDYYIWSNTKDKYAQCRIIFEGICDSNWQQEPAGKQEYYFHRFLEQQPDLNYKNPQVMLEMGLVFLEWMRKGVDGFRADAIPFLWKEEGTMCESLPQVHWILQFWRNAMDYVRRGTMILAEACQKPKDLVQYFGNQDECHAAYHFPLMVELFHAFAIQSKKPILDVLNAAVTPTIPSSCQWFLFLRCHDELTFEMITPDMRQFLYQHYCKNDKWSFREGQGVSARLADLLDHDLQRIQLAFSLLLTLIGTPIILYGDEFAKENDEPFYKSMFKQTQIHDTRYYNRGTMDWHDIEKALTNSASLQSQNFSALQSKLKIRASPIMNWLGSAQLTFLETNSDKVFAYVRHDKQHGKRIFVHNLSDTLVHVEKNLIAEWPAVDLLGATIQVQQDAVLLPAYAHLWM